MNLNVDVGYFTNLKTMRLTGLLGKGSEVIPLRLWAHCAVHHPESGKLTGYSAQEVETCIGWWGDPGVAVQALLKVRFLDKTDDGYQVHDWLDYQGHLSAYKERGRNAALKRWEKVRRGTASENDATSNARDAPSIAASNALASQPAKPTKLTHPPNPDDDVGGGGVGAEKAGLAAGGVAAELRSAGVKSSAKVDECARVPGLTPIAVLIEFREIMRQKGQKKVRDVGAVLAARLLDEGYLPPPVVHPLDVCQIANEGRVRSVSGHAVLSKMTYNDRKGVFFQSIDGSEVNVSVEMLTAGSIVLQRRVP